MDWSWTLVLGWAVASLLGAARRAAPARALAPPPAAEAGDLLEDLIRLTGATAGCLYGPDAGDVLPVEVRGAFPLPHLGVPGESAANRAARAFRGVPLSALVGPSGRRSVRCFRTPDGREVLVVPCGQTGGPWVALAADAFSARTVAEVRARAQGPQAS